MEGENSLNGEQADCNKTGYRSGCGRRSPTGSGCRCGHQLRSGADLSLVTVGFSWTLAKGFLRRGEECFEWFSGGVPSAALWLQTAPTWIPMAQPLSSGPGGGRGRGGEPERGAVRKASRAPACHPLLTPPGAPPRTVNPPKGRVGGPPPHQPRSFLCNLRQSHMSRTRARCAAPPRPSTPATCPRAAAEPVCKDTAVDT